MSVWIISHKNKIKEVKMCVILFFHIIRNTFFFFFFKFLVIFFIAGFGNYFLLL